MTMKLYDIPQVVGNTILLEIELDDKKAIKSEFLVIPKAEDYNKNVIHSAKIGKVIDVGPDAFLRIDASEPYCCKGDYVLFIQNAGVSLQHEITKKNYRVIKEGDILLRMGVEDESSE